MLANGVKLENINKTLVKVRIGNDFDERRGNIDRVRSWKKLQRYMIHKGMIGRGTALMNMLGIKLFVYSPRSVKHIIYGKLLRKQN